MAAKTMFAVILVLGILASGPKPWQEPPTSPQPPQPVHLEIGDMPSRASLMARLPTHQHVNNNGPPTPPPPPPPQKTLK